MMVGPASAATNGFEGLVKVRPTVLKAFFQSYQYTSAATRCRREKECTHPNESDRGQMMSVRASKRLWIGKGATPKMLALMPPCWCIRVSVVKARPNIVR